VIKKYYISTIQIQNMKTIILILFTITVHSQMVNHGSLRLDESLRFHTEFINKGEVNGSKLLKEVKGNDYSITHLDKEYLSIDTNTPYKVTLNGSPVIGETGGKWKKISDTNETNYILYYDKIKIGDTIDRKEIYDINGRYLGNTELTQKAVYIEITYYTNGKTTSRKFYNK
jgi:hypothetical protein